MILTPSIPIPLLNDEFATVFYTEEMQTMELIWKGFVPSHTYREVMLLVQEQVKHRPVRFWIFDATFAKVITLEDQQWTRKILLPSLFKAGLQAMGIVVSHDVFNKLFTDQLRRSLGNERCQYFDHIREAEAWVQKQSAVN